MSTKIDANLVTKLLEKKHASDIFIAECKDGPTHGSSHRRLDGWAMKRSWSSPCFYGYEIKVSRADFLGDKKWHEYLSLCNEFYFVAPKGIIKPDEIPEGAGFLQVATTGSRLFAKKRAPHRDIEPPFSLLLYVMMRARSFERYAITDTRERTAEYWSEWLESDRSLKHMGHRVSNALSKRYSEEVTCVQNENVRLKSENEMYADVKKLLEKLGVSPSRWDMEDRIVSALAGIEQKALRSAERLYLDLGKYVDAAKKRKDKLTPPRDDGGDTKGGG